MEVLLLQELFRPSRLPCVQLFGTLLWRLEAVPFPRSVGHRVLVRPSMATAQGRHWRNCDGMIMRNCRLEGHRCATAHLHTVARLECRSDVAGLPVESATSER